MEIDSIYASWGSISKKLLSCLANFGSLRGWGGLSDSVKKGTFVSRIFLSDNAEWSFKNLWKMISVNVKANKNNKK